MARVLAALLLLAPAAGLAGERAATLRVSARVHRSVSVSVGGEPGAPRLVVTTGGRPVWSGPVDERPVPAASAVRAEPSAAHPGWWVVTVLADATE